MENLRRWARSIRRDVVALYFAGRDARVPWYAKAVAVAVAAYALSPIDLIPDVIPILGQVDDLLIVPAGIVLAVKLIRLRSWQSTERRHSKPKASPPAAQPQPSSSQFGSRLRAADLGILADGGSVRLICGFD